MSVALEHLYYTAFIVTQLLANTLPLVTPVVLALETSTVYRTNLYSEEFADS